MPIVLKEFSWHQNDEAVLLKVDTGGHARPSPKNCALTVTSQYVKLSLSPFIFELFLAHPVEAGRPCKATFGNSHVALTLPKAEAGLEWDAIEAAGLDREQKQQRRQQAELEQQQRLKDDESSTKDKDEAMRKKNVDEQLKEMEQNRMRIERVKQEVVKQALADTLQWKQTLPDENIKKLSRKELLELKPEHENKGAKVSEPEEPFEPSAPLELEVSFTQRVFPTPKRESNKEMENKLRKQREEAVKLAGLEPEALKDADPGWMYGKSRELAVSGQFQGAAAVASHALASCNEHGGLRLVLGVASLRLGHWYQAIECCSRALEGAGLDGETRAKLVAVRGAALVRSGREAEGRDEIKSGLARFRMDPLMQTLNEDFQLEC